MKRLLIFLLIGLLSFPVIAADSNGTPPTVKLKIISPLKTFENGDKVEISAQGFAPNEEIKAAILLVYNVDGSPDTKLLDKQNLAIDYAGNLSGYIVFDKIDVTDESARILLSTEYSNVYPTEKFITKGNIPHFSNTRNTEAGPFTFSEASGDGIAQLGERFDIDTPNSGWTGDFLLACLRNEYSGGSFVTQVAVNSSNLSIVGDQLQGYAINSTTPYQASTDSITLNVFVLSGGLPTNQESSNGYTTVDNVSPQISAAWATSLTNIRIEFDEAVQQTGSNTYLNFNLSGTDTGTASPNSLTAVGTSPTSVWDLGLSGSLATRGPSSLTVEYDTTGSTDSLQDVAGNEVEHLSSASVTDSIPPSTTNLRNSANTSLLTIGEFIGNTTYTIRARVLDGNNDSSLDSVVFEGSDNGSAWVFIGSDDSPTTSGDDSDFEWSWNVSVTDSQFKMLRAKAFDNNNNATNSALVGSPTDAFNDNFEDTYRAIISSVTPDPVTASSGSARSQITLQVQNNYGAVVNTTGINNTFRFQESTTSTELWWDAATGGSSFSTQIDTILSSTSSSLDVWYSNSNAGGPNTLVLLEPSGNFASNSGVVSANGETITVETGSPSKIWVQLPGQSFVNGTGVTGTPNDSTTIDTLVVGLFVTDDANNLIDFDETRDLEFETTASDAPDATQPSVNGTAISATAATTISITFTDGADSVNVHFPAAQASVTLTVSDTTATDTLGGVTSSGVNITSSSLDSMVFVMDSPQRDNLPVTGTNTITAWDLYHNVITGFDASADNVTVTGAGAGTVTITGLGSGDNNVLNQSGDFVSGVADLTAQAMIANVTATGAYIFTATSASAATGQTDTVYVNAVATISNPVSGSSTDPNEYVIVDTRDPECGDLPVRARFNGTTQSFDTIRVKWGFNSNDVIGTYTVAGQSGRLTPSGVPLRLNFSILTPSLHLGFGNLFIHWWVENTSTDPRATIIQGVAISTNPHQLVVNPHLITAGGVNGGDVAQGSFEPGVSDQEILSILFQANPGISEIDITSLTFRKSGTGDNTDISAFKLYNDVNGNGDFDSGVDILLGSFSPYNNETVIGFNISNFTVQGSINYVLLTVDVTDTASFLRTLGMELNNNTAVIVDGTVLNVNIGNSRDAILKDAFSPITTLIDYSLPVDLVSFIAAGKSGKVLLTWQTASEINNAGFEVYRSESEEGLYQKLNQELIPGNGNSNITHSYSFEDKGVGEEETYFYKLYSRDFDGTVHDFGQIVSATVQPLPKTFAVAQNYPNPFNPTTRISFDVAQESSISLVVYNMLGQKVRTLIDNQRYQPGVYNELIWDARDDSGNSIANGIYYLVFSANDYDYRQVRKMVFMK